MDIVTFVLFLAVLNERIVEYAVKVPLGLDNEDHVLKPYVPYIAMVFGVLLAVGFQADLITAVAVAAGATPIFGMWPGIIVTGLLVGGGSNLVNDVVDYLRG